jgi:hypothetical protein
MCFDDQCQPCLSATLVVIISPGCDQLNNVVKSAKPTSDARDVLQQRPPGGRLQRRLARGDQRGHHGVARYDLTQLKAKA